MSVYNNKRATYQHLLERITLPSLKNLKKNQDMPLTIHNSISNKVPGAIRNHINLLFIQVQSQAPRICFIFT